MKEFKNSHDSMRVYAFWIAIIGGTVLSLSLFIFFAWQLFQEDSWIVEIYKQHFVAGLGLPFAALLALILVIIFRHQDGAIEVSILGFSFKGASGQIIMWVIVFLAQALALKLLW